MRRSYTPEDVFSIAVCAHDAHAKRNRSAATWEGLELEAKQPWLDLATRAVAKIEGTASLRELFFADVRAELGDSAEASMVAEVACRHVPTGEVRS